MNISQVLKMVCKVNVLKMSERYFVTINNLYEIYDNVDSKYYAQVKIIVHESESYYVKSSL